MKKVLSLVLVAVLAIGMGAAAFASTPNSNIDYSFENIKDFWSTYTLADGVSEGQLDTTRRVVNLGVLYPKDKPKFEIDLWAYMFGDAKYTNVSNSAVYVLDVDKLVSNGILPAPASQYGDWNDVNPKLAACGIDQFAKMNMGTWSTDNYSKYANDYDAAQAYFVQWNNLGYVKTAAPNWPVATNTAPQHSLGFTTRWPNGSPDWNYDQFGTGSTTTNHNRRLTATEIQKSRIEVRSTVSGDNGLIKSLEIERNNGKIVMKTITEFVSVDDKDVEVNIFLAFDGKRMDEKGVKVLFNLQNPVIDVYSNYNFVDLSEGYVAKAIDFNSSIAVYLGEGVTIHTKFFKDKKYYGIATRDNDEENERVFKQYKDVDNVLTLKVVGLNNVGDKITLNNDYADYFVYDKDMNYLGKGTEELNFSSKLYLAYNKLEIEEDEDETDEIEAPMPSTPENPETGGNGTAANNTNLNPGTGR